MRMKITRYSTAPQLLHWLTAVLVLIAFVYGPGGSEERVYSAARDFDRQLHESLGLCVFVLAVLRLVWRTLDPHPDPTEIPKWMGIASKLVQGGLYLLLVALPVTAITGAWLEGHALTLLGDLRIASPIAQAHDLGARFASLHTWLGDAIMWLAGAHAAAALYHHFVLKDGVLLSMLPRVPRARKTLRSGEHR
jgi:cytochrome b561